MLQPLIAVDLVLVMRMLPLKPLPHSLLTTCLQLAPPVVELLEELDLLLLTIELDLLLLTTELDLLLATLDLELLVIVEEEDLLELATELVF